jgi:integrase
MPRQVRRLTALDVRNARQGKHHDGAGLYLIVDAKLAGYWSFRYGPQGKRSAGLGPRHSVSLNEARDKANACRRMLIEGRDPQTELRAKRAALKAEAARITFIEAADAWQAARRGTWSAKHAREIRESLRVLVEPVVGSVAVDAIDTEQVLKVLQPLWPKKAKIGTRVRQRMEAVLDFARVRGWRAGDNPARWKGHLDHVLRRARGLAPANHHAALPYAEIPDFMRRLRAIDGVERSFVEFTILTCVRNSEARKATRAEIEGDVWTIPAERMKEKRQHRVPLSRAARAVLDRLRGKSDSGFIFAGRWGRPISHDTFARLKIADDVTLHGFRSSFKDWAEEQTGFPSKVIEAALSHVTGSETERAYQRGDLLDKRRALMEAWGQYCSATDIVLQLAGRRRA